MSIRDKYSKTREQLVAYLKQGVSRKEISGAVALGIFIAFFPPVIGVHTVLAIFLAAILKLNPVIVLLGTQVSNPFTFPFLVAFSAETGHLLMHGSLVRIEWAGAEHMVRTYLLPLLVGSLALAVVFSALSYLATYGLLRKRP